MTLVPERRAELRHSIAIGKSEELKDGGAIIVYGVELEPLLDATEPVADGEVTRAIQRLKHIRNYCESDKLLWTREGATDLAALLERLARQLAEAREQLQTEGWNPSVALSAIAHPIPHGRDEISRRRFGSDHEKPCKRPSIMTCAMWECQHANQCQWDEATQRRIEP
jgi:hypothetical protein